MSVSKRLRFEIFRRDNHACRYCGATASDTKLTIDHVVPTALGGTDEPSNLVTACSGCNSGKTSSSPDAPMVAEVAEDALRWARAQQVAAAQMLEQFQARATHHRQFEGNWNLWTRGDKRVDLPAGWEHSVDNFMAAGLPMPILLDCIDKAMPVKTVAHENVFRYTCGIAWNHVTALRESTQAVAQGEAGTAATQDLQAVFPQMDIVDGLLGGLVGAFGGDSAIRRLASECLWEATEAAHRRFCKAIVDVGDHDEALEMASEEASSAAGWFLNQIQKRLAAPEVQD